MKNQENAVENQEIDENSEFEDWEMDYTMDMVMEFLDETVVPMVAEFDFENEDENYVPGVATFTLFTKLVAVLNENGWSSEDLKRAIDEFELVSNDVVH